MFGRRKDFVLIVASVFIGISAAFGILALAELITRVTTNIIFLGNSSTLFSPTRFAGSRGNTPNVRAIAFGEPAYIDKMGFRAPSVHYQYPDDGYRILILGDSVTFGPGVREEKTFVGLLRSMKPEWAIFNASVIGYDINDYLNVSKTLLKTQHYSLAILVLCLNDVSGVSAELLNVPPISEGTTTNMSPNAAANSQSTTNINSASFAAALSSHENIVEKLRSISIISAANDWLRAHSKLYLYLKGITTDPSARYFLADYKGYEGNIDGKLDPLLKIVDEFKDAGIPLSIVISPYEYQMRERSGDNSGLQRDADVMLPQKKIEAFLSSHGINALDPTNFFRSHVLGKSASLFLPYDPMHFSETGHSLMFKFIKSHINPSG